jgi:hypothetical protein
MKCLERHTNLSFFSRIIILANDVSVKHRNLINAFKAKHKQTIAIHYKPRGLTHATAMQNKIYAQWPHSIFVKIDEDVFVSEFWLENLLKAYENHKDDNVILFSPLIFNNWLGRHFLKGALEKLYPDEFNSTLSEGPISTNSKYGVWIWKKILFGGLEKSLKNENILRNYIFKTYLNINCILFDNRLLSKIIPFSDNDEKSINTFLDSSDFFGLMVPSSVVHHYSFGSQQTDIDGNIPLSLIKSHLNA